MYAAVICQAKPSSCQELAVMPGLGVCETHQVEICQAQPGSCQETAVMPSPA